MVSKFDYYFPAAAQMRRIHLYLPDDYGESTERYPVLYMFDGHNLYFNEDAAYGKALGAAGSHMDAILMVLGGSTL